MSEQSISKLQSLAEYLLENKSNILRDWKKTMQNKQNQASSLASMSRRKFYDHIPLILDQLCYNLHREEAPGQTVARKHGADRWEYGFDLRNVTLEWTKLHQVLMKHINRSREALVLDADSINTAHELIARHIHNGIRNSIDEYYQLNQREAEAQKRDLEDALHKYDNDDIHEGQYLQRTSHDLKGLVYAMQTGFSLLENEKLDKKTSDIVKKISLTSESLSRLLEDMLDLYRLEANEEELEISDFDAAEELRRLCEIMQPMAASEQLELKCSGIDALPVQGDSNKVRRIAQNLLLNSLKYTQSGYVEMSWEKESQKTWLLRIEDTGPGLSATHAAVLSTEAETEYSNRNSKSRKGVAEVQRHGEGIGLLIVQQLCKLLDAIIDINTAPGEGTIFRIVFPVSVSSQ